MKSEQFFLLTLFVLLSCLAASAYVGDEVSRNIAGYRIVFRDYNWEGEDGVIFQVFRDKKKLLERRAHSLFLLDLDKQGESYSSKENALVKCADITGDGIVDLIVQEWSGGAYCCYKYDIYSLGPAFKHIWHHDAVFGHLQIVNGAKKKTTLIVEDTSFCNFDSGAQGSGAKPKIYLVWRNGFVVDTFATKCAASKIAAELESGCLADNKPGSEAFSKRFVFLIYSGQSVKALALLDQLSVVQKRQYLSDFFAILKKSNFYREVISINQKTLIFRMEKLAK